MNRFILKTLSILSLCAPAFVASAETHDADDGALIGYEVSGNSIPLVLLHSGMMSREDMRTQIGHFSQYFKVIAIDAREQGRSSSSDTQISTNAWQMMCIGSSKGIWGSSCCPLS